MGMQRRFNSISHIAIVLDPLCHCISCFLPPLRSTLDTVTFSFTSCPARHLLKEYQVARQVMSRSLLLHPQHTRSSMLSSARRSLSVPQRTHTHTQLTHHRFFRCGFAVRTTRRTRRDLLAGGVVTALVAHATRSTGSGASETSSRNWSIRAAVRA